MVSRGKIRGITQYTRPHKGDQDFEMSMEVANQDATYIQIIRSDEGLGAPDGYNSNPQHPSFALANEPNCYVASKVRNIKHQITFNMTKGALETDKIHAMRVGFMIVNTAFLESLNPVDEVSGTSIEDILKITHETTDRQVYPDWNGTDLVAKYSGSSDERTNAATGLTTDNKKEGVAFSENSYYNMIQYGTLHGKLKSMTSGIKWLTLTRHNPIRKINIHIKDGAKRMNPYTSLMCLVLCPQVDTAQQIPASADTTAISHVAVSSKYRYEEENENFDHARV